jgi:hypothetical protein
MEKRDEEEPVHPFGGKQSNPWGREKSERDLLRDDSANVLIFEQPLLGLLTKLVVALKSSQL